MVARLVARPFLVHIIVDARQHAQHLPPERVDAHVGADRVHHVDAERLRKLSRARLERLGLAGRSEERRVGKECVSPCSSRWSPKHQTTNNIHHYTTNILHYFQFIRHSNTYIPPSSTISNLH